jgi:hypothetical protein
MQSRRLAVAALAWATVALAGARAEMVEVKSTATSSAPGEPPVKVEMSYLDSNRVAFPGDRALAVASGPGGTALTLGGMPLWVGSAKLTFKNCAPPMRLTVKLAQLPTGDLSALSVTSGPLSLRLGPVGTSGTTAHFDARGKAQAKAEGAAYTLTARRRDNGEVEVQLRRGQGAALGKELTVSWQHDLGLEKELFFRAVREAQRQAR